VPDWGWSIEWLCLPAGGQRRVPALEWLIEQPKSARDQLLAIVHSVCTVGPDQWLDRTSHAAMRPPIAHLHEARDRHDQTLYRLFLLWQREERRVIIIDGRSKPNQTALDDAEYEAVAELAAHVEGASPFATADDITRLLLQLADQLNDSP
jgi:hypothetical protein